MNKKILAGVLALFILVFAAPAAFAAITDAQQKEINDLNKQIFELRKQVIDKYAAAGEITKEQADLAKKRIDDMAKYRAENGAAFGPGACGGPGFGGCGMGGGFGKGFGRGPGFNRFANQSISN